MQFLFKSRSAARAFVAKSTGCKVTDNGSFAKPRWGVELNRVKVVRS